ncbi:GVQW3 protein, partial [Acromyrmex insinuator]
RTNIKFHIKLGKNSQEILQMLKMVYGESAVKPRTVYKWVDRFKEGRENMIAEKLGISNDSVKVLTDEQKQRCIDCYNNWIENAQDLNFLKRVITRNESWIYEYDCPFLSILVELFIMNMFQKVNLLMQNSMLKP